MVKNTFKQFMDKSIAEKPEWGIYIHLCRVLQASTASRQEITEIFNKYMAKDKFLKSEKKELINYLLILSKKTG